MTASTTRKVLRAIVLIATLLAGCDQQAILDKLAPAEQVAAARDVVAKLAERNFAAVEARARGTSSPLPSRSSGQGS